MAGPYHDAVFAHRQEWNSEQAIGIAFVSFTNPVERFFADTCAATAAAD